MTAYSAKELVYARAIAEGLITDADFRVWLTGDPALSDAVHDAGRQARLRSRGMKNPYWFNLWCARCDRDNPFGCKVGSGTETDVFLVFGEGAGCKALHIEIKRTGGRLGDGQALSYQRRAACWAKDETRPRTVPPHQSWQTILVHGDSRITDAEKQAFQRFVTHDEIRRHRPDYPA